MSFSPTESRRPQALEVTVSDDALTVELVDGRTLSVPLSCFPRLAHGTLEERSDWRLIGRGEGVHWPDFDEDISIDGLLAGRASAESQASLDKWLQSRRQTG